MNPSALLALRKEFTQLKKQPFSSDYAILDLQADNLTEWLVVLFGPDGTCFEGGAFVALMRFPSDYPFSPPSLQFQSHIYHPNVYMDGKLCLSVLQMPAPDASLEESKLCWSCALGVHGALQSAVSLLADPNPNSPANAEAAALFVRDYQHFSLLAKQSSVDSWRDLPKGFVRPQLSLATEQNKPDVKPMVKKHRFYDSDEYCYSDDED